MFRNKKRSKRILGCLLAAAAVCLNYSPPVQRLAALPDTLTLRQGQPFALYGGLAAPAADENHAVLRIQGDTLADVWQLEPVACGESEVEWKLFGVLPVKRTAVVVAEEKLLVPGGQSIGVAMHTAGVLVVGRSDIITADDRVASPAKESDLRPGDVILQVEGQTVKDSAHLGELVEQLAGNAPLTLRIEREGEALDLQVQPLREKEAGAWRLGVWVRDSTAGVGTLTYYDPETQGFGALGHAVTDLDTGALLSVKQGDVLYSTILDVQQGRRGLPGELKGYFSSQDDKVGSIEKNTPYGVFGRAQQQPRGGVYARPIPIAPRDAVHTGAAQILSTVDGEGVKAYDVRILRLEKQDKPDTKGIVLQVTDEELLKKTGGIVQGMSGSPIIQDGKIVGAVTHVLVNDPTKGYGIFIENMLSEAEKTK